MGGGTLRLGALDDFNGYDVQGYGTISSSNSIINAGLIIGNGLTFNVAGFRNTGTFEAASGSLTLNVSDGTGGFTNFNAGILTGGNYGALIGGTLLLNIGGEITTNAANIAISSTTAAINQIVGGSTVALASTLTTIAANGTLTIAGSANYVTTNTLDVFGAVVLGTIDGSSGTLSAGTLLVESGSRITGYGAISGAIFGTGTIAAAGGKLVVSSTGTTALQISQGTLELTGTTAGAVNFTDTHSTLANETAGGLGLYGTLNPSTLILDSPDAFSATIYGFMTNTGFLPPLRGGYPALLALAPDSIVLSGISLSSVRNLAYSKTTQGGVLSFQAGTLSVALNFIGQYQLTDFALAAGPMAYSNSVPSLNITDTNFVAIDTAAHLLTIASGVGFGAAASVSLTGTANTVTAAQATTLMGLKGFTIGTGASLMVSDSADNLIANLAGASLATSVALSGASNTITAVQAALLAGLPGFSLSTGATLVVSDTAANFVANPSGLGFATSIVATDTGSGSLMSATGGGTYSIGAGFNGLTDTATVATTVFGGAASGQLVIAGAGDLAFNAGSGAGTVVAGGGNNLISVYPGAGVQNIATGVGNDTIAVLSGANTIAAGAGLNLILAQGGNDLITSSGMDLIDVPDGNSTINAGSNAPTIFLGSGRSQINAGQGNATVVVGTGAATVNSAGAGQIWMQAGGGVVNSQRADTVIGGTGVVTVNAGIANDFVFAGPGLLNFFGGTGVSTILGASAGSASISGGVGSVIAVAYGATSFVGGAGAATVAAYGGSVTISGGAGTGVFLGGPAGGNRMAGGSGHATLIGGGNGDVLTAWSGGGTVLQAGSGAETLTALGSTGRNNFYGGSGADVIVLGAGGDQVLAGTGAETMIGGAGADLFAFASGNHPNVMIENFVPGQDYIALLGFGTAEAATALSNAVTLSGSEQLTLSDGTRIQFLGIRVLGTSNFL